MKYPRFIQIVISVAWSLRLGLQAASMPPLADASPIRIVEGPALLHANAVGQWGGHTFSYVVTGEKYVFWSGMLYEPGRTSRTMLVGQYPKNNVDQPPVVTSLSLEATNFFNSSLPLLARTPDGFIHLFVGVTSDLGNPNLKPGVLRYYRSAAAEDISRMIDRTELIPTNVYHEFHLRMNVGLSPDGNKLVWVTLAVSADGKVPFNTPVVFFAERRGVDFSFQEPKAYAAPMGLFYPLVAVMESGAIVVGELWNDSKRPQARLLQLDWSGKLLHQEDLPIESDGTHCVYDLKPRPGQPENFILYAQGTPADRTNCFHEFWEYSAKLRRLRRVRAIATDYSWSNTGKWLPLADQQSVFVNNPSAGQLCAWHGDLLGTGEVKRTLFTRSNPIALGLPGSYYVMAPNPLVGSIQKPGEFYLMTDVPNAGKKNENVGPCSLLLYRLEPVLP
ncbi:MAG TPA: hypothetical protein VNU68_26145 [Verrucomicrobiae bacterium]|nr:hypothetical protein [Verrucomicrobiae bacterium]